MKKVEVKVKIIEMTYKKENHLFLMKVVDIEKNQDVTFAISGDDFGLPPDVPQNLIDQFCKDMQGKEKNLHIETDDTTIKDLSKDGNNPLSPEEIQKVHNNMNKYPIDQVMNMLDIEEQQKRENSNED